MVYQKQVFGKSMSSNWGHYLQKHLRRSKVSSDLHMEYHDCCRDNFFFFFFWLFICKWHFFHFGVRRNIFSPSSKTYTKPVGINIRTKTICGVYILGELTARIKLSPYCRTFYISSFTVFLPIARV